MKKMTQHILYGISALLCAQLPAQSTISDVRSALFGSDFESAQSMLASQPPTAEAQILRSMVDIGLWVENDLPAFAASIGADASAAGELADLSSYFDRDGVGRGPQTIFGSSTPLEVSESGGIRTYQFPANEKGVLVLHNTSEQDQGVVFDVSFGDMSGGLKLFANNEYMGRASLDSFSVWTHYEYWYDPDTNQRSFGLLLEPGDYIRLEEDYNYGFDLTTLSFAKSAAIEEQNGNYWRYNWLRDPANTLFDFELLETTGAGWQADGVMVLDDLSNETQELDYWFSYNDLHQSWNPDGRLLTLAYQGAAARQMDLTFYQNAGGIYYSSAVFFGLIHLNGIEIGEFRESGFSLDNSEINERVDYGIFGRDPAQPLYTISLWLEPGDQLTLQAEPRWSYYYGTEDPDAPLFGFTLDDASDVAVNNGTGFLNVYPKFKSGTNSDQLAQFLFSPSAPSGQLLSTLVRRLSTLSEGFSVTFDPEETGFAERLRVEYADVQVILACLKFSQGMQLLHDMYSTGTVDVTYANYLDYLEDPVAIWEDHPEFLDLIQSRSSQGTEAKALFQQAVNHYNSVESVLWSRLSGATESFLFEVENATQTERAEFSDALADFIHSLDGSVALADDAPEASVPQSVSLQPLVAAAPVSLRGIVPQFDERGFRGRTSQALADSGFMQGVSVLDIDDFLVDHDLLFVAPPASLAGKVMLVENWGSFNWARFSDPQIMQQIWWGSTSNTAYTWDADAGVIYLPVDEFGGQRSYKLIFEDGLRGRFLEGYNQSYYPAGRFLLYDGAMDLDDNGRSDALDLANVTPPAFAGLFRIEDVWNTDSDQDGRVLLDELVAGTNPARHDALLQPSVANRVPTPADPTAGFEIRFQTEPGNFYQVEYSENLGLSGWLPFGPLLQGDGSAQSVEDLSADPSRFYRIRISR